MSDQEKIDLLTKGGWKKNDDGTWTNEVRFDYRSENQQLVTVPEGVTRGLDGAVELELLRPKTSE